MAPKMRQHSRLRVVFRRLVLGSLPMAGLVGCGGSTTKPAPCPDPEIVFADAGVPPDLASGCSVCKAGPVFCSEVDAGLNRCQCAPFTGRRPAGLAQAGEVRCDDELGAFFAHAAHLEAASVHAFHTLREELAALGAPVGLVRAAGRAARDEILHARATAALARAHGAEPLEVAVASQRPRSLEEIALENVVEGCVRETFGALVATWQGEAAQDAGIRSAMGAIARDETRHAGLAWQIAGWAEPLLAGAARLRVEAARAGAWHQLGHETRADPSSTLQREAGVPSAAVAQRLLSGLLGFQTSFRIQSGPAQRGPESGRQGGEAQSALPAEGNREGSLKPRAGFPAAAALPASP